VHPLVAEEGRDTDAMMEQAPRLALAAGLVRAGDKVVITAGVPMGVPGSTNLIKAAVVPA
jgi:pyruvate kinase